MSTGEHRTLGIRVTDWPPPNAGEARLLGDPRLERLTRVHPAAPSVLFLPVVVTVLWRSALHDASFGAILLGMLGGLVLWTLTEYAIHRVIFHLRPQGRMALALAYLVHGDITPIPPIEAGS